MEIDGLRKMINAVTPQASQLQAKNTDSSSADAAAPAAVSQNTKSADIDITLSKSTGYRNDKPDDKKKHELEAEASDKMLKMAVENANKKLSESQRMLQCSIHEKTKRIMVKIIDTDNDEVVREIPPEKTLDLFAKVLEMAGLLFDEKK